MAYHHLTYHDRIIIGALLESNKTVQEIALKLGRPKSTVYRELQRNSSGDFYYSEEAEALAADRKSRASANNCIDDEMDYTIEQSLQHGMSPEQIAGRLVTEGEPTLSVSTIYRRIAEDKQNGGNLWMGLRHSGKTYRKKYAQSGSSVNGIKNRISIEKRPKIINKRKRHGDLEGDTIIGAKHKGILLTLNDRVTQKVSIDKLKSKQSNHVCAVMIKSVDKFIGKKHSCTLDNGKEFAGHEKFTKRTGTPVYFSHPMSPHERGSNENMNGLIRQYIPKGTDISKVSITTIKAIEYCLNSRPRKSLNYKTPLEVESKGKLRFQFYT